MSRAYEMSVSIEQVTPERKDAVIKAAEHEWNFQDWRDHEGVLFGYGEGNLCGGEAEDEFAGRLASAIWQANGRYIEVTVRATYLENLPSEDYILDEENYAEWLKERGCP